MEEYVNQLMSMSEYARIWLYDVFPILSSKAMEKWAIAANILGSILLLTAFAGTQLKFMKTGRLNSIINVFGAALFLFFCIIKWGPGGVVLETFWVIFGIWGALRPPKKE